MNIFQFLGIHFIKAFNFCSMRWFVWRRFDFFLPPTSVISQAKDIQIGNDFACGPFCQILCQNKEMGSELVIGNWVSLNSNVMINADNGGKIYIDDYVIFGPNVVLRAANHSFDKKETPIRQQKHVGGTIHLEEDVWLGAGVTVLPNVRVGRGSVIGAGSVVTKDIPAYSIAVGNPAQVIKERGVNKQ